MSIMLGRLVAWFSIRRWSCGVYRVIIHPTWMKQGVAEREKFVIRCSSYSFENKKVV